MSEFFHHFLQLVAASAWITNIRLGYERCGMIRPVLSAICSEQHVVCTIVMDSTRIASVDATTVLYSCEVSYVSKHPEIRDDRLHVYVCIFPFILKLMIAGSNRPPHNCNIMRNQTHSQCQWHCQSRPAWRIRKNHRQLIRPVYTVLSRTRQFRCRRWNTFDREQKFRWNQKSRSAFRPSPR